MNKKVQIEILWWLITAVVVVAVMFPIVQTMPRFPYFWVNVAYIAATITFIRYSLQLEHTFLARQFWLKAAFVLGSLALLGLFIGPFNDFQRWWDENDHDTIFNAIPFAKRDSISSYVKSEFAFFAIGGAVGCVWLSARLFRSLWRQWNHDEI